MQIRPFFAASWLRGAHEQSILPVLFRRPPRHPTERVRLPLPDGDFLDLDVMDPGPQRRGFALVLHGLEGSSRSVNVLGTVDLFVRRGIACVAPNYRGCSGEPNSASRAYHAGDTDDVRSILAYALGRFPGLPGVVAGFSMGANLTLKLAGEEPERGLPDEVRATVGVSAPFDISRVVDTLDTARHAMYRAYFLKSLVPKSLEKARRFPHILRPGEILRSSFRMRDFDGLVTARLHGFESAEDYYARSSCGPFVPKIRRPALLISADDDPLIPGSTIPIAAAQANPFCTLVVTRKGGHCGFVSGTPRKPRFWAEEQLVLWSLRQMGLARASDVEAAEEAEASAG